jgi:hypothetical protein
MSKERHIETFNADWNGIGIQITWEPSWLSLETLGYDTAHLQVESILPERVPLPITETGYRSHFTSPETVAALGGPVAFVIAWLDEESQKPAWREREQAARQLSLF